MDPSDIEVKFRKGPNGQFICFSDACHGITGVGNTEAAAANHFWKAFNKMQDGEENAARQKRHDQKKTDEKKVA